MLGNMNPKQMEKMMRQMGMKTEEVDAREVIIRGEKKEIVIVNPSVQKVNMMGQETFQIMGQAEERDLVSFSEDDIAMVVEQTGATDKEARDALESTKGDLAEAIMKIKS